MDLNQERIEEWLSEGLPGFERKGEPCEMEGRFIAGFKVVLSRLREPELDAFFDHDPRIFYFDSEVSAECFVDGVFAAPSNSPEYHSVSRIYFAPHVASFTEEQLQTLIAHETGHIVLGHHKSAGTPILMGENDNKEEEADRLSVSWGFLPCYKKEDY